MASDTKTRPQRSFINLFVKKSTTTRTVRMAEHRESKTTRMTTIAAEHRESSTTRTVTMASGHREFRTTRTVGMASGQLIPYFMKPQNNSLLHECTSSQVASDNWIKRLKPSTPDSYRVSSKRLKTGDNSYKADARNLLGMIMNYEGSKCRENRYDLNKIPLTQDGECSYEESKAMNLWISRWCRGSMEAAPLRKVAAPVLCEPEKLTAKDKTSASKKHPSIAAMALMGAAAKKSNSFRYKKKGALLVWNIQ